MRNARRIGLHPVLVGRALRGFRDCGHSCQLRILESHGADAGLRRGRLNQVRGWEQAIDNSRESIQVNHY